MIDEFYFQSPFVLSSKILANVIFLKRYMWPAF